MGLKPTAVMTPEEYVGGKGWKVRNAPGELQTQCVFCGDTNKYGHLYINREHGAWKCHRCGEQGSFVELQVKLGDTPALASKELADKWDVWDHLVTVCQDALIDESDAIMYLRRDRGLTPETIGTYRLGWVPRNIMDLMLDRYSLKDLHQAGLVSDKNYPLFWNRIMIPYLHDGRVIAVRAKEIGGNVLQAKDSSIRLFGVDQIRGQAETYLCEGEFDAMYLSQLGYPAAAIPGALSFQEHWVTYFDHSRRVFICMDNDEAGMQGTAKIQREVGPKAKAVTLPLPLGKTSTDITEFFLRDGHTKDEFDALVDEVRGQRLYSMMESTVELHQIMQLDGVKLEIVDFDYFIEPGLLPGQVMVVLAKTGTGKTAFLTQVVHNLSGWESHDKSRGGPSRPILFLSLEQTKAEIANRLLRTGRLYNPWASDDDIHRWHRQFRIVDENRIPSGELLNLVDEYIIETGKSPELLILDYLGYWARSFEGRSRYEQVSEAIMELKGLAKETGIPVVVPHQVNRLQKRGGRLDMDFARDSGVIEESADFMVGLRRPNDKEGDESELLNLDYRQRSDVRLELAKSRHGNVGRESMLLWAPYSLGLVPRGDRIMEERIEAEWKCYDRQMSYDEVLDVHKGRKYV